MFVFAQEDKKEAVYSSDFLTITVFSTHPLLKHTSVVGGGALVAARYNVMIDWGHKRQRSKCVSLNLQPSFTLTLADWLEGDGGGCVYVCVSVISACIQINVGPESIE